MIAASILLFISPRILRGAISLIAPLLTLAYIWAIPNSNSGIEIEYSTVSIAGFDNLLPLFVHKYSHIFGSIFSIAAFSASLFALKTIGRKEITAAFLYAGSAIGVTFSGDLISLFLFWELMAIGSTIVVWCGATEKAYRAGLRYAAMHFLGGVVMMIGIVAYIATNNGDATITNFVLQSPAWDITVIAPWLILIGVLVNTATPPFSSWLPDSYPEASVSGMVFLSAFTTKTAIFVLMILFAGNDVLIYLGVFMIFYGIVYAILENNMRRILAFSIINQVGFMMTGIGIGTELSLNGAAAHAFCHIIYKALLLMSAGAVIHMTGKHKCSELGGLYSTMRITAICGIVGALAISAFPFTSGFISKSMISSAAHYQGLEIVWYLLAAATAGVFLHAGIKFPWFVFFQRDSMMRPKDPPWNMRLAMIFLAVMCIIPGIFPQTVYFMLPGVIDYDAYAHGHTLLQLELLTASALIFFVMLPLLKRTNTISLDFDWFYRKILSYSLLLLEHFVFFLKGLFSKVTLGAIGYIVDGLSKTNGSNGLVDRSFSIGTSALWATILLGLSLAIYYVVAFV
jgi:multicomponent Na+:H+ antiporter subunit D